MISQIKLIYLDLYERCEITTFQTYPKPLTHQKKHATFISLL